MFYKSLKEYAADKGVGYAHFITRKNKGLFPKGLIRIPKGSKYIEINEKTI